MSAQGREGRATEYVMVPVPEEYLADVTYFLMQRAVTLASGGSDTPVTQESVVDLMATLNPRARSVLVLLAGATAEGDQLSIGEIAASLGWSAHEASGVVHELQELVWENVGPMMNRMPTAIPKAGAGVLDWYEQKVMTWQDLADAVIVAEGRLDQEA